MTTTAPGTTSGIDDAYRAASPHSAALYARAVELMPSGINHDVRRIDPFPIYVDHADGARKWDADGHELIDYAIGHGALILGHGHPAIVAAIREQAGKVTHASAPTEHEVRWAELVTRLVPCAEKVRFMLSGTEATMLAMRIARGATGKDVIVRIQGHFHGWHDYAMLEWLPPYEIHASTGVPAALDSTMRAVPRNDLDALDRALAKGDVAAVIAEPDGPVVGTVPVDPAWVRGLREVTDRHGVLLIFDEVVTGFRLAPGGAQEFFGVTPDLATFAKAIAGGVPGAAVAGRADLMDHLAYTGDPVRDRRERVIHMGTYSAHPMAAVAGSTALELLADGSVQDRTAELADRLRAGFNDQLWEHGIPGAAYGLRACFRVVLGDVGDLPDTGDPAEFLAAADPERLMVGTRMPIKSATHKAFFLEGIDILAGNHGWVSGAHTEADIDASIDAFGRALGRVVDDGLVRTRRAASAHADSI